MLEEIRESFMKEVASEGSLKDKCIWRGEISGKGCSINASVCSVDVY